MPTKEELEMYYQDTYKHIVNVQNQMYRAIIDLQFRSINHDASKYSKEEAHTYAKVVPMFQGKEYGTPEHRAVGDMLGEAWEHHEQNNDHHTGFHENGVEDMNLMSIIEMLCDWKAASMRNPNQDFKVSCLLNCKKYELDGQLTQIVINTALSLNMMN